MNVSKTDTQIFVLSFVLFSVRPVTTRGVYIGIGHGSKTIRGGFSHFPNRVLYSEDQNDDGFSVLSRDRGALHLAVLKAFV